MVEARRLLVISDTHGSLTAVQKVLDRVKDFDVLLHAGDYLYHGPRNRIPKGYDPIGLSELFQSLGTKLVGVRGNCDADVDLMVMKIDDLPQSKIFSLRGLETFLYHGHRDLKIPDSSRIIISGHTHISQLKMIGDTIYLNPGSVALPKDSTDGTYALIEIFDIIRLNLFDIHGNLLKELELIQ
ncbi:phosphodiesterase [Kosmotoga sp.]|uniref:phosphodiesterase n=1 Tax=Kosmotoga sp. TaxID=1955248 RepID=UPI0024AC0733|nr:phosphodiesterase [Kosmotoga sp.]MDI3523620.1 uncharacterized protein [Kosmotoga sp.]